MNKDQLNDERERRLQKKRAPFFLSQMEIMRSAMVTRGKFGKRFANTSANGDPMFKSSVMCSDYAEIIHHGAYMEKLEDGITQITETLLESRTVMRETLNELRVYQDQLDKALAETISMARAARMNITSELSQSLSALKQIQEYLRSSDYKDQVAKLEQITHVISELKELHKDGVLDEVVNVLIRLNLQEQKK